MSTLRPPLRRCEEPYRCYSWARTDVAARPRCALSLIKRGRTWGTGEHCRRSSRPSFRHRTRVLPACAPARSSSSNSRSSAGPRWSARPQATARRRSCSRRCVASVSATSGTSSMSSTRTRSHSSLLSSRPLPCHTKASARRSVTVWRTRTRSLTQSRRWSPSSWPRSRRRSPTISCSCSMTTTRPPTHGVSTRRSTT